MASRFTPARATVFLALAFAFGCSASAADSNSSQQTNSANGGNSGDSNPSVAGAGTTSSAGSNGNSNNPGSSEGGAGTTIDLPGMSEVDGGAAVADCYSPTQNTDTAYEPGSQGCPCEQGDQDVCIEGVALICEQGFWRAVEDGPCEPMVDPCAAQDVMMVGGCEPAPVYFWNGSECMGQSGCSCEGSDCDAGFASQADCEAAYSSCVGGQGCGGFLGNTCTEEEYCAYQPGEYCGAADASATCQIRPMVCTKELVPVCGCDGMTYGNECEANAAGTGVYELGECATNN